MTTPAGPGAVRRNLPSLTAVRAIAAAAVLVFHLDYWQVLDIPGAYYGSTGVALFFVLSGFILTWTARPELSRRGFYLRRVARIYPDHLVTLVVALVVALVVGSPPVTGRVVGANVLLLQAWSLDPTVVYGLNGVAWSLSCELAFYLAFPFLLPLLRRWSPRTRLVVALVALAIPLAATVVAPTTYQVLYHFPLARFPEFVLGVVAGLAFVEGRRSRVPWAGVLGIFAAVLVAAELTHATEAVARVALVLPFALFLMLCAERDLRGRRSVLTHRVLIVAGSASYAFYLVHELVIRRVVDTPLTGVAAAAVITVASGALAYALYRFVEEPARHLIVNRWGRRMRRRTPTGAATGGAEASPGPTASPAAASTSPSADPAPAPTAATTETATASPSPPTLPH
ncbi:acyltransferase family protein [Oerskovia sp. NPDC060287]|uniref:acyltransferase family protein n=1 Tax=Oerskovia sp. NPDC060287 TaxID=3347095 RepID=UPI0036660FB2